MRNLNPLIVASVMGVLAVLLVVYVFAGGKRENPDRLSDQQVAGTAEAGPEERCRSQATHDLLKKDLFRRAAQVRGDDQAVFNNVASYASVRVQSATLRSHDEETGTINCSGDVTIDLPPGVAVVGGRRTLTGTVGYAMSSAGLALSNADAIVVPLATLGRVGSETARVTASAPAPAREPDSPAPAAASPEPAPPKQIAAPRKPAPAAPRKPPTRVTPLATTQKATPPRPPATANPSFNCRYARTRGEIAVCNDTGLAGLDRQMASSFNAAMSQASRAQRTLLQRTRGRFLSYRDSCGSNACMAGAYRDRMREISDIMAGRWQP